MSPWWRWSNGTIWYADGVLPAAQVMERSIGVLAGVARADAVAPTSGADALLASRLAARAFSSGDVGQFDTLMAAGTRANLADNPARRKAPSAPRWRCSRRRSARTTRTPSTRADVAGAAALERRAATPRPTRCSPMPTSWRRGSADATAQARLLHYRGLDALNQGQLEQALALLTEADAPMPRWLPADALAAHAAADAGGTTASRAPDRSAWPT